MSHDPEPPGVGAYTPPPLASAPAPSQSDRVRYQVRGMDCDEEVGALRAALAGVVVADELSFDVLTGVMEVPRRVDSGAVLAAVASTGMRAQPIDAGGPPPATWWEAHGRSALAALSGAAVAFGFGLHASLRTLGEAIGGEGLAESAQALPGPVIAAYVLAVGAGLLLVLPKAWRSLRSVRPDMNLLMTLAVAGAIGIGEWFEAAAVSFLFALSLALEAWSVGRARRAIEKLLALAPPKVRVRRGEELVDVDPGSVSVGTVFNVRPGERFGLDGVVVDGRTEVDQAPITGESRPVPKEPESEVYAGTINGSGSVDVEATRAASDTTLAQIVRMVGEARKARSGSERWVEKFARICDPAEHCLRAGDQGRVRRVDLRRPGLPVGGDRRRHGGIPPGRVQLPPAPRQQERCPCDPEAAGASRDPTAAELDMLGSEVRVGIYGGASSDGISRQNVSPSAGRSTVDQRTSAFSLAPGPSVDRHPLRLICHQREALSCVHALSNSTTSNLLVRSSALAGRWSGSFARQAMITSSREGGIGWLALREGGVGSDSM